MQGTGHKKESTFMNYVVVNREVPMIRKCFLK